MLISIISSIKITSELSQNRTELKLLHVKHYQIRYHILLGFKIQNKYNYFVDTVEPDAC